MPPLKKPAAPTPTPRAAALSQSASRFAAGATSAWQDIASQSPRLAAAGRVAAPLAPPAAPSASRVAREVQRPLSPAAPTAEPETTRQVGWHEVDRAVSMHTKRKYNLLGVGFGPKVPVFETEKVKLPVYQETNRSRQYYAAVRQADAARIKRDGFQPESGGSTLPKTVEQFNAQGRMQFFGNEASAHRYAQQHLAGDYVTVAFTLPEYHNFTPTPETSADAQQAPQTGLMHTAQSIPATCIKSIKKSLASLRQPAACNLADCSGNK